MWLTEGCGGRRRAVATPNRESRKEKKKCHLHSYFRPTYFLPLICVYARDGRQESTPGVGLSQPANQRSS